MVATLFATRVVLGKDTFEKVPPKLKEKVANILLNEYGMSDTVPVEFGGTLNTETSEN